MIPDSMPGAEKEDPVEERLRIMLLGKSGVGKSSSGNTILGRHVFKSEMTLARVTRHCEKEVGTVKDVPVDITGKVKDVPVAVIDTPGFFETDRDKEEIEQEILKCVKLQEQGPHAFVYVISVGRMTQEDQNTNALIEAKFGPRVWDYTIVLFTHGDRLEGKTINDIITASDDNLRNFIRKCSGGFHVFNNKNPEDQVQVSSFMAKIQTLVALNGGGHYHTGLYPEEERKIRRRKKKKKELWRKEENNSRLAAEKEIRRGPDIWNILRFILILGGIALALIPELCPQSTTTYGNNEMLRIVMVGKTGVGKSATGNTILGNQNFQSEVSAESLTTHCAKAFGEVDGQKVAVIDTPGLFDTRIDEEKTIKDIAQSISYSSPGPHAFLVVIRLGRFTEEEQRTVQMIQEIFGEGADKYSMVLFTHGDLLKGKPIEEYLLGSTELQELVAKCNGQYHVFNNDLKDRTQVRQLLDKIRNITEKNGGSYYTTEMFQKAEKAIEERKQQILKEKEEQIRKQEEEINKKFNEKYEQLIREVKDAREREKLREDREREIEEEKKNFKERLEREARMEAENSTPLYDLLSTIIIETIKKVANLFIKSAF